MKKKKQTKASVLKTEEVTIPVRQKTSSFCDPLRYKVLSDREVNLTRKRAFEFLEAETFTGERAVRERHVQHLYDEFVAGRFVWHHVILALAMFKGTAYRMNGQHTCWMRVNIPESQDPPKCEVREIIYDVYSEEDLRALYSTFDRNAPRTPGHISKVILMNTAACEGVPASYIGPLCAGFRVFWCGDADKSSSRARTPVDELLGLIKQNYSQLFNLVGRFFQIHQSESPWTKRAGVLGAMFATFEKAVQKSDEFWTPVVSGIGLDKKTDARYQLRRWMDEHNLSSVVIRGGIKTSTEEVYRVSLAAWNRWRNGETVELLRVPDSRPKVRS